MNYENTSVIADSENTRWKHRINNSAQCARKMSLVECRVRVQSLRARVPRGYEGEGEENPVNGKIRLRSTEEERLFYVTPDATLAPNQTCQRLDRWIVGFSTTIHRRAWIMLPHTRSCDRSRISVTIYSSYRATSRLLCSLNSFVVRTKA